MLQQKRHIGSDCRYPDYMDVVDDCFLLLLDSGIPCRNGGIYAIGQGS